MSRATGWDLVPPTVLRDGPLGPGACQLWIDEPDDGRAAGRLRARRRSCRPAGPRSRRPATRTAGRTSWPTPTIPGWPGWPCFDAVINNADRKGGHVLPDADAGCTAWTTASASTSRTSCARCCGAGPASRCPRRPWTCCDRLAGQLDGDLGRRAGRAPDRRRGGRGWPPGSTGCGGGRPLSAEPPRGLAGGALAADLSRSAGRLVTGGAAVAWSPGRSRRGRCRSSLARLGHGVLVGARGAAAARARASRSRCSTRRAAASTRPEPAGRRRCTSAGSPRTTRRTWATPPP